MTTKPLAFLVHLLTASGAVLSLLALIAATGGQWATMFLWLGVALAVDGIDGPLARKLDAKQAAARWNGDVLDLVVDYLSYVFVPAYALVGTGLLPPLLALVAAALIALSAALYFAHVGMKMADNSFAGFPAAWQMVLLVLLTLAPPAWVTLLVIAVFAVAQFTRLKFVHPGRTVRWRALNLPIMLAWASFAAWSIWADCDPPLICKAGLALASAWIAVAGIAMQTFPPRGRTAR